MINFIYCYKRWNYKQITNIFSNIKHFSKFHIFCVKIHINYIFSNKKTLPHTNIQRVTHSSLVTYHYSLLLTVVSAGCTIVICNLFLRGRLTLLANYCYCDNIRIGQHKHSHLHFLLHCNPYAFLHFCAFLLTIYKFLALFCNLVCCLRILRKYNKLMVLSIGNRMWLSY